MKRVALVFLCLFVLCGCNKTDNIMDKLLSFRQKLIQSKESSLQCKVTADYGQQVYSFTMLCNFDQNGNMRFTVLEPESISGITGTVDYNGGNLTFDDNLLGFPLLADGYLTPVSAPWLFMKTLRSGYIDAWGERDDGWLISLYDSYEDNTMQVDVIVDLEWNPVSAEFIWDGRRILSLTVSNFSYL